MKHSAVCIPASPRGATLFSIVVAAHRISGNGLKKATLRQLFGRADANIVSSFSASAILAEEMGLVEDGADLLSHAGLFGFYSSAMSKVRAEGWLSALRCKASGRHRPQQFITGMAQQKLVKRAMYCCPRCVSDDEEKYGLAWWHTIHQIPGVHHCPIHRVPLLGACLGCGRSQGSEHEWNLPASSCPHCGASAFSTSTAAGSHGYERHLSLVQQVCLGQCEFLRPQARNKLFKMAFGGRGRPDVQLIIRRMLEMWGCTTLSELSSALGSKITPQFVDKAIRGADAGVNPSAHLALVSVAQSTLRSRSGKGRDPLGPNDELSRTRYPPTLTRLEAALDSVGLPTGIAAHLGSGFSLTKISAIEAIPYPRLRRQVGRVLERNIDELCCFDDGSVDQTSKRMLETLAEKLRGPLRRNNRFIPQASVREFEELRALNRAKVDRYLQQGIRTRKQLHYKNSDLGDWCRRFDAEWFESVLPMVPQSERRGIGRRKGGRNSKVRDAMRHTACADRPDGEALTPEASEQC